MTGSAQELFNKLATKQQLLWSSVAECYSGTRGEEEEELWVDLAPCHHWADSPPSNTAPIPNVVSIDYDCDDAISDIGDIRHYHYKPPHTRSGSHGSDGSNDSPFKRGLGSWMKNQYPRIDENLASSFASKPIQSAWEKGQDFDHRGELREAKERYYKRMTV
jgi:hypothetical protein